MIFQLFHMLINSINILIAQVQFKPLQKNSPKGWNKLTHYRRGKGIFLSPEQVSPLTTYNIGDYESRYSLLEKACLALVWATQRLRHCMLAVHRIYLYKRYKSLLFVSLFLNSKRHAYFLFARLRRSTKWLN